nr:MAG TPA: hypothetical protein [Caudoviricetes sp.]
MGNQQAVYPYRIYASTTIPRPQMAIGVRPRSCEVGEDPLNGSADLFTYNKDEDIV